MPPSMRVTGQQARRRAVSAAAWQLFTERGYEATTIRQIAERAGVSVGTVMSAGDKAALLLGLMEDAIGRLIEVPEPNGADAASVIWQRLRPFFDFYASMPELAKSYGRLLFTSSARQHPALTAQAAQFSDTLADDIRRCHPQVTDSDAAHAAEAIFACYLRALISWGTDAASLEDATAALREQIRWQLARFQPATATPKGRTT
jgi:AcrR family transcriptional regulator